MPNEYTIEKSANGIQKPEELKEVLDTDPEADSIFNGLTEGNHRSLIYLVTQVKSSDK